MASNAPFTSHKMGLLPCISYVVGNIIGSGIFITPSAIANYTQSVGLSLLIWIICAALSILGSIVYVELATSIAEEGCDYAYTLYVGWRAVAFSFMFISVLLSSPASIAVQSITFGEHLVQGFAPYFELDGFWAEIAPKVFEIGLLGLLSIINFYALEKFASRFQTFATVMKMAALVTIISAGAHLLVFKKETSNIAFTFSNSNWDASTLALAIYGGLWSYGGWDVLNYGIPEIHQPRRTIPLSLVIGLSIVCVSYLGINVSFFTVLSIEEVSNSSAIAAVGHISQKFKKFQRFGFQKFAERTLGKYAFFLPIMISINVLSTINSNIYCSSRTMHAAAKKKQLPSMLSGLHVLSGSPRAAVLAQSILAVFFLFFDLKYLINCVVFVTLAQRMVTCAALLLIRWKGIPVQPNPIRVPILLIVLLFIVSTALVLLTLITEFFITLAGAGILSVLLITYSLLSRMNWSCITLTRLNEGSTLAVNKLLGLDCPLKGSKIARVYQVNP